MSKFRKKPVTIEARVFEPALAFDAADVAQWCGGRIVEQGLEIPTLEGTMLARPGDLVIQGVQGEFYPCKSDIFEATYEEVADEPAAVRVSEVRGVEAS